MSESDDLIAYYERPDLPVKERRRVERELAESAQTKIELAKSIANGEYQKGTVELSRLADTLLPQATSMVCALVMGASGEIAGEGESHETERGMNRRRAKAAKMALQLMKQLADTVKDFRMRHPAPAFAPKVTVKAVGVGFADMSQGAATPADGPSLADQWRARGGVDATTP